MELLLWWGCFSFSSLYIVRKCQSLWIHTMRLVQGNTLTIIAAYLYTSHHISKNEPISILIQQFPYNPIQMHIFMVFWLYIVQRISNISIQATHPQNDFMLSKSALTHCSCFCYTLRISDELSFQKDWWWKTYLYFTSFHDSMKTGINISVKVWRTDL